MIAAASSLLAHTFSPVLHWTWVQHLRNFQAREGRFPCRNNNSGKTKRAARSLKSPFNISDIKSFSVWVQLSNTHAVQNTYLTFSCLFAFFTNVNEHQMGQAKVVSWATRSHICNGIKDVVNLCIISYTAYPTAAKWLGSCVTQDLKFNTEFRETEIPSINAVVVIS